MNGSNMEPNSEEEIRPSSSDIHHINMNHEETEPMNFVEVKCELEVRQVVGLGCKHSSQGVKDYYFRPGL
jgi:hypothetical protein